MLFCVGEEWGVQFDLHGVWGGRGHCCASPGGSRARPRAGGEAGPACRAWCAFLWPAPSSSVVLQGGAGSLSSEAGAGPGGGGGGVGDPLHSTHWHPLLLPLKACRGALPVDTFVVKALRSTKAKTNLLA